MNAMQQARPGASGSLHVERSGQGPELVLVHGWGMHSGVWAEFAERLALDWSVSAVDLPGHGLSADQGLYGLDSLAQQLAQALPGPRIWIGWSLGALACMQLALTCPAQVAGLGLLAATPRFTSAGDWDCGIAPELLQAFAAQLEEDVDALLLRFLSLQVQSASEPQSALKALRARCSQRPRARLSGLRSGLAILSTADLRPRLAEIRCPAVVIAGTRDRVVPPQASAELAAALPQAHYEVIAGAGHAPFVAEPVSVAGQLAPLRGALPNQDWAGS